MGRLTNLKPALQSLDMRTAPSILTNGTFSDPNRQGTTARGYGWEWQKKRVRILKRDNYTCQECRRNGHLKAATDVDHITRKADGGTDDDDNLQSLCKPCHDLKTEAENASDRGSRG